MCTLKEMQRIKHLQKNALIDMEQAWKTNILKNEKPNLAVQEKLSNKFTKKV